MLCHMRRRIHACVIDLSVVCVKRDLLQCQKRPTTVSKETCYSVKRDLEASKET
jgi:hypothetical protein